jgi:molybdate transport system substrate-binding protein
MATRQILAELGDAFAKSAGDEVAIESVGGVDAAKRIRAGEAFDFAVLASDALEKLQAEGHLVPGSIVAFADSPMAMAVRAGAARPATLDEAAVREAMAGARSIGISTGPSGTHVHKLAQLFGMEESVAKRIIQAPPGIPVASLIAGGEAEIGFQQLSELIGAPGVEIAGKLPPSIQPGTVFAAGVCRNAHNADRARAFIDYLASGATAPVKRKHGMEQP